jgi:3-phosphoinositide dependent protein kinase-1
MADNTSANPEIAKKLGVDDFEFGKTLGEGSFGDVVLCTHKASGRQFAAKKIEKQHLIKTGNTKYAVLEREVLTSCQHPNIIKLSFSFRDPSCLYYILELAPNGELKQLIKKKGNLDLDCSRFFAAEIVNALDYLHNKMNIIHRDLKPENILLSDSMHVKLTDFGTAKRLADGQHRVRTASFMGTAEYIAPECLAEEPEVCRASDLWALGCIIYQMLTGSPPFHGDTQFLTFEQVNAGKVHFPPHFPYQAKLLIESLLVQDPDSRLGANGSYQELKEHAFFAGIDFSSLETAAAPEISSNPEYQLESLSVDNWSHLLDDNEKILEYGPIKQIGGDSKKSSGFLLLTSSHLRLLNSAQSRIRTSIPLTVNMKARPDDSSFGQISIKVDSNIVFTFQDRSEYDPERWRRILRKAVKKLKL